jgi:hypothetical protein
MSGDENDFINMTNIPRFIPKKPRCPCCQSAEPRVGINLSNTAPDAPQLATVFCQECGTIITCQILTLPQPRVLPAGGIVRGN